MDHNGVEFDYNGPIVDLLAPFWTSNGISEPVDLPQRTTSKLSIAAMEFDAIIIDLRGRKVVNSK